MIDSVSNVSTDKLNGTSAPNPLPDQVTPVNIAPESDPALRAAWKRLLQYDRASFNQKQQHIRIRAIIILMGFLSSFVAVIIAAKQDAFSIVVFYAYVLVVPFFIIGLIASSKKKWTRRGIGLHIGAGLVISFAIILLFILTFFIPNFTQGMLQLLVFVFALFASGFLAYATRFIPSELWAKYRFSAEMIRRHIYLYKMEAGDYFQKTLLERQTLLTDQIKDADSYSTIEVDLFTRIDETPGELEKDLKDVGGDHAFQSLSMTNYFQDRLWYQHNWYVDKSFNEYREMRNLQVASIVIGAMGSILVFAGYAPWVAVTTFASVSVNMLAGLSMYGRTYSIYLKSANKLRQLDLKWNFTPETDRETSKFKSDFVHDVETVFKEELDLWIQQVQKSVSEVDQELSSKIASPLGDTKPNDKKV